jgi:diguanylate cyclase (GGDEF)-like protein
LPGLFNRRGFHEGTAWITTVAVLMIHADRIRVVTDRFGHDRGDAVLHREVEVLSAGVLRGDVPAPSGGEECFTRLPMSIGVQSGPPFGAQTGPL